MCLLMVAIVHTDVPNVIINAQGSTRVFADEELEFDIDNAFDVKHENELLISGDWTFTTDNGDIVFDISVWKQRGQ